MIDLWTIPLDLAAAPCRAYLTPAERAEMRMHGSATLADRFALRRTARRLILAEYLDQAPLDLVFGTGLRGKPDLPGLAFSASHSGSRGVLAVSKAGSVGAEPIGVDIERIRPIKAAVFQRILAPGEKMPAPDQCLSLWTAKEAVVKGLGIGLDLDLMRQIEVDRACKGPWCLASTPKGGWMVQTRQMVGFVISIAARAESEVIERDALPLLRAAGIGA